MPKYVVPDMNSLSDVKKVLQLLAASVKSEKKSRKRFPDIYTCTARENFKPRELRSLYKKCIDLICNCLQNQQFEEAAKLLWIISQEKQMCDHFFYKAVMIVLENLHLDNKNDLLWLFVSNAGKLALINKKEIQLEYIIYGLKNDVHDLQHASEELLSKKVKSKLYKNERLDPILDAYSSLINYVEWCRFGDDEISTELGADTAEKVIINLMNIIKMPGQWDVFVLKIIEMLLYYDKHKEAEAVLLSYVASNPNHINGYIYLCTYLCMYNPDSPVLMKNLEILAQLCPSDPRILILIEKRTFLGKKRKKNMKHIFMFLDYPSNAKNVKAWLLLAIVLHQAILCKKTSALKVMKSAWKMRKVYWDRMHFNVPNFSEESIDEITDYKIKVLEILEPSHPFIQGLKAQSAKTTSIDLKQQVSFDLNIFARQLSKNEDFLMDLN